MTQTAREPPYRRHDPRSTPGFGKYVPLGVVKNRQPGPASRPASYAPPAQGARPLWAEMSDSLSRKLGLALVRGDDPTLRLRVANGQAELSAEDVLELNTLLLELYADVVPISTDEAEDGIPSTPIA